MVSGKGFVTPILTPLFKFDLRKPFAPTQAKMSHCYFSNTNAYKEGQVIKYFTELSPGGCVYTMYFATYSTERSFIHITFSLGTTLRLV